MKEPTSMHPTRIDAGRFTGKTQHIDEREIITFRVDEAPDYHIDGHFINVYLQKNLTGEYTLCVRATEGRLNIIPVSSNTVRITTQE